MSDETQVAPAAETQNTAAEPAEQTAVAEPDTTQGVQDPAEAKPEKTAEQKELEYLRRKATKADRINARLHQELEQVRRAPQAPEQPREKVEVDPHELDQVVTRRAQEIARAERLDERCNAIVEQGRKAFPDFSDAVAAVGAELPLFGRNGAPSAALETILEADNPAALLHHLGKNPDLAAELADLTPTQLTRRLVRLEGELTKPQRQASAAPKPLEPVKPAASSAAPDPATNPEAWRAWRNKTAKR